MTNVTCQVYRLEVHDTDQNRYAHHTTIVGGGFALFGYGRIGAKYQYAGGRGSALVGQRKMAEKQAKGYRVTWQGDISIPEAWLASTDLYGDKLQQAIEQARMEGRTSFGTDVAAEATTPLQPLVAKARSVMSKMADNPDTAVRDYAALVDEFEAAKGDVEVVSNYVDTLRIMLAGAGRGVA